MKILNVAEKPSMAKSITQSLADSFSRRPGMNKYCLNYDFTYARVSDGKRIVNMTMTSVLGHVMNYQFPEEFTSWQAVPYVELLGAPVVKVVTDVRIFEPIFGPSFKYHLDWSFLEL
jgi:DNA topoisomerase-3